MQYTVDKGVKHKVTAVNLKGNKYFDTDTILERLSVKKADTYQRSGRYSQVLVNSDVSSILALYRANGFNAAKVSGAARDTDKDARGQALKVAQIVVTFTIVEGPQQKFGDVQLAGVDASRMAAIKGLLQTEEDQPFSLLTLSGDRDAVLSYYVSHGFDQAKVEIKQEPEADDPHRDRRDADGERRAAGVHRQGAAVGHRAHAAIGGGEPASREGGGSAGPGGAARNAAQPVQPGAIQRGERGGAEPGRGRSAQERAGADYRGTTLGRDVWRRVRGTDRDAGGGAGKPAGRDRGAERQGGH